MDRLDEVNIADYPLSEAEIEALVVSGGNSSDDDNGGGRGR